MSKRRHRNGSRENNMGRNQGFGANQNNRFPFGINPQQLLGMLGGNFDMNRIGNMLNSMNMDGFDLNSMNIPNNNGFNFNSMMNAMNGMNTNMNNNMNNNFNSDVNAPDITSQESTSYNVDDMDDENIQLLMSLRRIVDPSKIQLIDKMIELYNSGAFKENK